ncbi:MAG: 4-hydroxy-tetrahydrodipicolinate reductase [Holosporaceae bacterium]
MVTAKETHKAADLSLGILGCGGRMGSALFKATSEEANVTFGYGSYKNTPPAFLLDSKEAQLTQCAETVFQHSQVVVDFSHESAAKAHLALAAQYKKPFILATTGFREDISSACEKAAKHAPVMRAPNTSIGANLLKTLVRRAAEALNTTFDVTLLDRHHTQKKDAPSGTALMLAHSVQEGRRLAKKPEGKLRFHEPYETGSIQIASLQAAKLFGSHEVAFTSADERLTFTHDLLNREALAKGALLATKWLAHQKPGLYTMEDVLFQP